MDIVKILQEKMSQNTYLVIDDSDAILIDSGASVDMIEENLRVFSPKPRVKAVFVTHAHFDHILNLDSILKKYDCPAYIFKSGKSMLFDEKQNLSKMDESFKIKTRKNIKTFADGQIIEIGTMKIHCYNTPGHSQDSSCFVIDNNMFTGDTIFKIEVGRTDLFSGDSTQQRISLERLKNDLSSGIVQFYPGHGPNFDLNDLIYNIDRILGEN